MPALLPTILTVNPMAKKHRRARQKRAHSRFRYRARQQTSHNPHRRSRRRGHHNPFSVRSITGSIMPAAIGAGGAVLTDVAMAYLPIPTTLQSGWLNILTRAAVALGVGYVAGMVVNKRIGQEVAAGGLIVVTYSALKTALAPTLGTSIKGLSGLADFGDYSPAYSAESAGMLGAGMGAYMQPRLGAYMQPRLGAYMSPGSVVRPATSPLRAKQAALAGFNGFHGYDSESM